MQINVNIENTMRSGQVFSYEECDGYYKIYSSDKFCIAIPRGDISEIICDNSEELYWKQYFNETYFENVRQLLSEETNPFIQKCYQYANGLVILKQDLWEMIVSYIVSQRNSIPAIKNILLKFRKKFGTKKTFEYENISYEYYTFPTAESMKAVTLDDLQGLSLGYRDKYILSAIQWYNQNKNLNFSQMTRAQHIDLFKQINGVGEKVANCISLFAMNDFDCFPIDIWIQRVLDLQYINADDIKKYSEFAGFLNQIIYFYVIDHKQEFKV